MKSMYTLFFLITFPVLATTPILTKSIRYELYFTDTCALYSNKVIIKKHNGHGGVTTKTLRTSYSRSELLELIKIARNESQHAIYTPCNVLDESEIDGFYNQNGRMKKVKLQSYECNITTSTKTGTLRIGTASNKLINIVNKYCPEVH
ncbi:MAG TPA: hypothetical protein VNJ08_04400 [Bacteriovoracaceae bacterium]|nr:hypothetical protein [Bacteriovoracaceae bacterium]